MKISIRKINYGQIVKGSLLLLAAAACFYAGHALATDPSPVTGGIGEIAQHATDDFQYIGELMYAIAYLAGFGFVVASIFKFKQHKDNPTQIPMGTPIAMLVIGIALIFLPTVIGPAGKSVFATPIAGGWHGKGIDTVNPTPAP